MIVFVHPWVLRHLERFDDEEPRKATVKEEGRGGNGVPELSKQCFKKKNVTNCVKCH